MRYSLEVHRRRAENPMKAMSLRIADDTHKALRFIKFEEEISLNDQIQEAIRDYLAKKTKAQNTKDSKNV